MPSSRWDPWVDRSLALRADPYRFLGRACRAAGRDAVELRLLGRRTIAMTGPRAAEVFYDPARFRRAGAAPEPLRATLFGKGGVQGLDGAAHAVRRAAFVALLGGDGVARLVAILRAQLDRAAREWWRQDTAVPLHEGMQRVLARTACDWAGVALPVDALPTRATQLASLYADAMSRRHFRARLARRDAERWLVAEIDALRAGRIGGRGEAFRALATLRDEHDRALPPRIAAVELLNLLRPIVAVSVWIVFAAHALQRMPAWRDALRAQPGLVDCFVQEVRRDYPFFPLVAARVAQPFEWDGVRFPAGRRAVLDLYGTDHDPRCWEAPERFRPERFLQSPPGPWDFVPQGGGDLLAGHRCPGEAASVELTKAATLWLVQGVRYEVAQRDLELDMTALPALPRAGFTMLRIKPA